ncbi:hypothetical protein [Neobacillus ginsengisoli]|uniref:Uncharacterized protein n=1 Tax=Neobacillus ginsengisoli TaxID=904295 RepID=A0ABT9Y316_9BACI|nr:hypothetical protein [Neobacillus ginsengisoli]MDQ0202225.1 hypothetical protein [Neobacillus ginsengisoli]
MKALLELVRIAFIFVFFVGILSAFITFLYSKLGTDTSTYGWMIIIAIIIFFFVLYRNKYQFSGWYTGKRKKLPKKVSLVLISVSILLLLLPCILSFSNTKTERISSASWSYPFVV